MKVLIMQYKTRIINLDAVVIEDVYIHQLPDLKYEVALEGTSTSGFYVARYENMTKAKSALVQLAEFLADDERKLFEMPEDDEGRS